MNVQTAQHQEQCLSLSRHPISTPHKKDWFLSRPNHLFCRLTVPSRAPPFAARCTVSPLADIVARLLFSPTSSLILSFSAESLSARVFSHFPTLFPLCPYPDLYPRLYFILIPLCPPCAAGIRRCTQIEESEEGAEEKGGGEEEKRRPLSVRGVRGDPRPER